MMPQKGMPPRFKHRPMPTREAAIPVATGRRTSRTPLMRLMRRFGAMTLAFAAAGAGYCVGRQAAPPPAPIRRYATAHAAEGQRQPFASPAISGRAAMPPSVAAARVGLAQRRAHDGGHFIRRRDVTP